MDVRNLTLEDMVKGLAERIKDQTNLVTGLQVIIKKNEHRAQDADYEQTFDMLLDKYERERKALRNMRKSLEYMVYATDKDLTPDERDEPEKHI